MHPIYERLEDKFDSGKENIERMEKDIRGRDYQYNLGNFTPRELRFVYEAMKGDSGKESFITSIAPSLEVAAVSAIRYFTNTTAIIRGMDHNTGRIIIESLGQQ